MRQPSLHYGILIMFEFTETISIDAQPGQVWQLLSDVERWWPPSNPDHIRIEVRSSDKSISVGTQVMFEERVAGVSARAEGAITRLIPEAEATWEGLAVYRYWIFRFKIHEGVSWRLAAAGTYSKLSAKVWARFPPGIFGRLLELYAWLVLTVVKKDREHARRELEYIKHAVERAE